MKSRIKNNKTSEEYEMEKELYIKEEELSIANEYKNRNFTDSVRDFFINLI